MRPPTLPGRGRPRTGRGTGRSVDGVWESVSRKPIRSDGRRRPAFRRIVDDDDAVDAQSPSQDRREGLVHRHERHHRPPEPLLATGDDALCPGRPPGVGAGFQEVFVAVVDYDAAPCSGREDSASRPVRSCPCHTSESAQPVRHDGSNRSPGTGSRRASPLSTRRVVAADGRLDRRTVRGRSTTRRSPPSRPRPPRAERRRRAASVERPVDAHRQPEVARPRAASARSRRTATGAERRSGRCGIRRATRSTRRRVRRRPSDDDDVVARPRERGRFAEHARVAADVVEHEHRDAKATAAPPHAPSSS